MHVVAQLFKQSEAVLNSLTAQGIEVRPSKGGMFVTLPLSSGHQDESLRYFDLPVKMFNNIPFRVAVEGTERGGLNTESGKGRATVVCSTQGAPLVPNYIFPKFNKNGDHARFTLTHAFVSVSVTRNTKGQLTLRLFRHRVAWGRSRIQDLLKWYHHQGLELKVAGEDLTEMHSGEADEESPQALLAQVRLYEGLLAGFQKTDLSAYDAAVAAATAKCGVPNCDEPMFIVQK